MKHGVAVGWLGVSITLAWLSSAQALCLLGLGCPRERFIDTGPTIIDRSTGLEWEKKTDDGSVHDVDNEYVWSSTGTAADGSLFAAFLGELNSVADCTSPDALNVSCAGACFAGRCDWRVPEIDELRSILDGEFPDCESTPCIDPAFGPTVAFFHWSATTHDPNTNNSASVNFGNGLVTQGVAKDSSLPVRAVRNRRN